MNFRPIKRRLGDVLKAKKSVTEADLLRLMEQAPPRTRLGDLILDRGLVSKEELVMALQEVVGCHYLDARFVTVESAALRLLPKTTALRYCVLPIAHADRELVVLMADPQDLQVVDELRFISGVDISPRLGLRSEIESAIDRCYDEAERRVEPVETPGTAITPTRLTLPFIDQNDTQDIQFFAANPGERSRAAMEEFAADLRNETTPAVKLASAILTAAVTKKASDVHIEPHDDSTLVRIRVDGFLRDLTLVPNELQQALVSRLKILANMDIAERRAPQDGRFLVQFGKRRLDVRVSSLPTHDGEKVVMRLLDPAATKVDFTELGFSEENAKAFRTILAQPQGMVLVTGPTGSGKSTTLYSALNVVTSPSLNIITVEDPVEYKIREINQVQINPKAGLTFAGTLRAILRQDPNVIMVGEVRDPETAEIALQAAQTGHLVLSSLHTNDSVSAVTRLMDLKIPGFLIASSVSAVIAQRLVRKLCFCRTEAPIRAEYVTRLNQAGITDLGDKMYVPTGCAACDNTGYKGRVALYEMLVLNDAIRNAIRTGMQDKEICAIARNQGMRLLHEDGMVKVRMGLTTIEEIARVVGFAEDTAARCSNCTRVVPIDFRFCSGCGAPAPQASERQQAAAVGQSTGQHNLSYVV
jgi:type IV pilus assembly protein PilB